MAERDVVDEIVDAWKSELPQAAGLPLEVSKRVKQLALLFDEAIDPVLAEHHITKAEYGVLASLRAAGSPYRRKPRDLSGSLVITSGGISNVLGRLEGAGLVVREPDPDDGRSSFVRLTPHGVTVAEAVVLDVTAVQNDVLKPIPDETARALADLLRDVIGTLDMARRPRRR